jgi:hypothetical protein
VARARRRPRTSGLEAAPNTRCDGARERALA